MTLIRKILFGLGAYILVFAPLGYAADQPHGDPIEGLWYTEGREGGIELYKCGTEICGRIYWLKDSLENGGFSLDTRNPNSEKRGRPLCHMKFMGGFTPDGSGHYKGGWIYSPRHGAEFTAEMSLIDRNTLELHGYIFIPLFGQSQIWKRAETMPECSVDELADQP